MKLLEISVLLFFVMFIYSGFRKILNFKKKVEFLSTKTGLPSILNNIGMLGVIGLEVFGSLLILLYVFKCNAIDYNLVKFTNIMYLLFLIVVTMLYHPPWDKIIPFLSNLTTFAGLLFLYILLENKDKLC
tara:strand:+ start:8917 stop:9306 length:390 start_codon:yes stop_codon:yes gene_type:complete